jgi:hypothetical protein
MSSGVRSGPSATASVQEGQLRQYGPRPAQRQQSIQSHPGGRKRLPLPAPGDRECIGPPECSWPPLVRCRRCLPTLRSSSPPIAAASSATTLSARDSGELVVIDGPCLSACTLVVGMVPRDNVCATPKAVLGFHSAWRPVRGKRIPSAEASQAMLDVYPTALREWINHRGGLSSKMIFLYGRELAGIVRPCAPAVVAGLSKVAKSLTSPKLRRIRPAPFPVRAKHYS